MNAIKLAKEREAQSRNANSNNQNGGLDDIEKIVEKSLGLDKEPGTSMKSANNPQHGDAASAISQESEDSIPIEEKSLLQKIVRTKLVDNRYDLEILRKDPSSPLHSVKSFEALHL